MQHQQENTSNITFDSLSQVDNLEAAATEKEEQGDEVLEEAEEDTVDESPYITPPELTLSRQEEEWTWDIVCWFELHGEEEGLKKPTDYEFVLYAMTTKGNTEEAVERMRGIQVFRETYNIQDTVEEGVKSIQDFIRLQPGMLVYVDSIDRCLGREGIDPGTLLVWDYSKYDPARSKANEQTWRIHVLFFYYVVLLGTPSFDVMRGGLQFLIEGEGISRRNIDFDCDEQTYEEIFKHSPIEIQGIRLYNTNFLINWALGVIKQFMTAQMREALQLGCQLEVGGHDGTGGEFFDYLFPMVPRLTLPDIYLRPNYDVAMLRLLDKSRDLLDEYYYNMHSFEF